MTLRDQRDIRQRELIVFTAHYPFMPGEEYLVREMEILSTCTDKIRIICGEKYNEREKRIIPENVDVILVNQSYDAICCFIIGIVRMFSPSTFREILYAPKIQPVKFGPKMLKRILIYNFASERCVRWIKKNIIKSDPDKVLYSYWLSSSAYALSRLKKKGYKFKALSRAHGFDAFLDREYQAFRREIYAYLDEIHFVSEIGRSQFESEIVFNNDKENKKAKLLTSRLGTSNGSPYQNFERKDTKKEFHIVTCSSIIPLKRLDILVDTLSILKNYNIKWTHFGEGYLREKILNRIHTVLRDSSIIVAFMGQTANEKILEFYEQNYINLFVNISDYEGVPVSIMEALSYGIPVIARNVGGNSEIVENMKNGLLLSCHVDKYELKRAIEYFIKLPYEVSSTYRKNAYITWQQKYNADNNYLRFAKRILNDCDKC